MNNKSIKVAMVNYLNSRPFGYGMNHIISDLSFDTILVPPAECALLFKSGAVDLALVPVGALDELDFRIISDYCIACDGEVRTVCLFSDIPIEHCNKIWLDSHSRTSSLLTRLILEQYYGKKPDYETVQVQYIKPGLGEAVLMIGDKVFEVEHRFQYKYDLGQIWKNWTGLPFVFAVWVASDKVEEDAVNALNQALALGVSNLSVVIDQVNSESLDLISYFRQNIYYHLDEKNRQALQLFRSKCESLKSYHNFL